MAGGQRVDDHSWWAGKGSGGSVFPMGCKVKEQSSASPGAGALNTYEDTSDQIKAQQMAGIAKAKAHPVKPHYKN